MLDRNSIRARAAGRTKGGGLSYKSFFRVSRRLFMESSGPVLFIPLASFDFALFFFLLKKRTGRPYSLYNSRRVELLNSY